MNIRIITFGWIVFFLLFWMTPLSATQTVYYDLAIFAFEERQLEKAETYALQALKSAPENPRYQYLLGKIYFALDRFSKAETFLENAWHIAPGIPGLAFDRAYLQYRQTLYQNAANQFSAIIATDSADARSYYYGGLSKVETGDCKTAVKWLTHAAQLSPGLIANVHRHLIRCQDTEGLQAVQQITIGDDTTDTRVLNQRKNAERPLLLYFRTSVGYDSNVPLDPTDRDVYSDQSDLFSESLLWGQYHLLNRKDRKAGIGLRAYQSLYPDLNEFNLTAFSPTVYGHWHRQKTIFKLSYYPSWFWFDGQSYLLRHNFIPEVHYHANQRLQGRLRYLFQDNDYKDDNEHDGDRHSLELETRYHLAGRKGHLFGGIDLVDLSAASADLGYQGMGLHAGLSLDLSRQLTLRLEGRFDQRSYDETDIYFFKDRKDNKYTANLRLKRRLFYDWLEIEGEGEYTHNDSNIDEYGYQRMVTKLSLILRY